MLLIDDFRPLRKSVFDLVRREWHSPTVRRTLKSLIGSGGAIKAVRSRHGSQRATIFASHCIAHANRLPSHQLGLADFGIRIASAVSSFRASTDATASHPRDGQDVDPTAQNLTYVASLTATRQVVARPTPKPVPESSFIHLHHLQSSFQQTCLNRRWCHLIHRESGRLPFAETRTLRLRLSLPLLSPSSPPRSRGTKASGPNTPNLSLAARAAEDRNGPNNARQCQPYHLERLTASYPADEGVSCFFRLQQAGAGIKVQRSAVCKARLPLFGALGRLVAE